MAKVKEFQTKSVSIELEKIKLDLNNVRFQHSDNIIDDKKMEELIWNESSTQDLYEQIKAAGGLYEEPIVEKIGAYFKVLEGNRRITCLRRLQEKAHAGELPGLRKNTFDIIKCCLVPENITEAQKQLYLAALHVRGKQPWPAFNKAKHIYDLYNIHEYSYDSLAKNLNMGKVTVIKTIRAYEETQEYGKNYKDDSDWYKKYTYFYELFQKRDLKDFSKIQRNVDKFSKWLHDGKFRDVRDIRVLGRIINDDDLMHEFEAHGFKEAFDLLQEKDPILKSKEFRQIKRTIEVLKFFSRQELINTIKDPYKKSMIIKLKAEVDSLYNDVNALDKEEKPDAK